MNWGNRRNTGKELDLERDMRNWEIDMAKKEFLQSGMTIPELLKKKGYTQWGIDGRMWIPPGGGEMSAIPKDEALQRILINWNN